MSEEINECIYRTTDHQRLRRKGQLLRPTKPPPYCLINVTDHNFRGPFNCQNPSLSEVNCEQAFSTFELHVNSVMKTLIFVASHGIETMPGLSSANVSRCLAIPTVTDVYQAFMRLPETHNLKSQFPVEKVQKGYRMLEGYGFNPKIQDPFGLALFVYVP